MALAKTSVKAMAAWNAAEAYAAVGSAGDKCGYATASDVTSALTEGSGAAWTLANCKLEC